MFSIRINDVETECEITFGTALDYELEFGKDMIADINGSVTPDDELFTFESGELVKIDFGAVPWTKLLKVLWCAVRTRNPRVKPFKKWASECRGINMMEARNKLNEEMDSCFFRDAPLDETSEQGAE